MLPFSGEGGFNATGSLLVWAGLGLGCLADFAAAAMIVAALAPTWRLAPVISAGYAAPALPFSGFSIPSDSMSRAVDIFGHCLPLTWYIQAPEWTLGDPIRFMGSSFGGMAALFIFMFCASIPLIKWSFHKRATKEAKALT